MVCGEKWCVQGGGEALMLRSYYFSLTILKLPVIVKLPIIVEADTLCAGVAHHTAVCFTVHSEGLQERTRDHLALVEAAAGAMVITWRTDGLKSSL